MRYITALTIAGSDCSGGAGVQADIKTMASLGVYATSAITAVTTQNTQGVQDVDPVSPRVVESQVRAVFDDMVVDAVKVGMLVNVGVVRAVAGCLLKYKPRNVVLDPVMVSTSGHLLMDEDALSEIKSTLLPLATLVTPNIPEAERLSGLRIRGANDFGRVAAAITQFGCRAVLIKGGHLSGNEKVDRLYVDGQLKVTCHSDAVDTRNTHGTGCTLSSAIASLLARGEPMEQAVCNAVRYLHGAIDSGQRVVQGAGHGPVCHGFLFRGADDHHAVKRLDDVSFQFISHSNAKHSHLEGIKLALEGGCRWIQLRMKDADEKTFVETAKKVRQLCSEYHATFIVDDRVEHVKAVGADGVHLGKNDMSIDEARKMLGSRFIIGGTANTLEDVERIYKSGADYIGCGPFRFTTTKKNLSPMLGLEGYKNIVKGMRQRKIALPLVAIGGILPNDVCDIMKTGVTGVAVSGAILNADDPASQTDLLKKLVAPEMVSVS